MAAPREPDQDQPEPQASSAPARSGSAAGAARPKDPGPARGPRRDLLRPSVALSGLFVLALFYTLYFARAVILPVTLAVLVTLVLRPIVRALRRLRIPDGLGAAIVLCAVVTATGLGVHALARPAGEFMKAAPANLRKVERKLRSLRKPVQDVSRATDQMERLALGDDGSAPRPLPPPRTTLSETLAVNTRALVAEAVLVLFLCYFLLASGERIATRIAGLAPGEETARRARDIGRTAEREVSRYLFTISIINLGEGVAIAAFAWAVGLPSPLLWGAFAAVANFVPYLGALVACATMTLMAFVTLPTEQALVVPVGYLVISGVEGYLVTPLIVGRRLLLDPVVVFLGVIFWGWLWGIPGAIMAVPLLAAAKIVGGHVDALAPFAAVLGDPSWQVRRRPTRDAKPRGSAR